ncbi:MAG TPA: hypothetical protein VIF15_01710 [Polyangiaceae bacterium]|jgi:hypothetical protein
MRKAGLALALAASAQLTLLSSPAFAQQSSAAPSPSPAEENHEIKSQDASSRARTGWIVLGIGGALTIGGIVLDIVGTQQGTVSGQGGNGDNGTTSESKTNFYWGGTALIVTGVLLGIWGGSMVANADKADAPAPAAPPAHETDDASRDSVTRTAQASLQRTPTFTLPIIGATF